MRGPDLSSIRRVLSRIDEIRSRMESISSSFVPKRPVGGERGAEASSFEEEVRGALERRSRASRGASGPAIGRADGPSARVFSLPRPRSREIPGGLRELVEREARSQGLDPALAMAVVEAESSWRVDAVSPKGAMGLMQLMPGTARMLGVDDPFDPEQNVWGGVRYLKMMVDRYGGRLDLALAAYNAGPGAVDRYGGIPPYEETRSYVEKVLRLYRSYRGEALGGGDEGGAGGRGG